MLDFLIISPLKMCNDLWFLAWTTNFLSHTLRDPAKNMYYFNVSPKHEHFLWTQELTGKPSTACQTLCELVVILEFYIISTLQQQSNDVQSVTLIGLSNAGTQPRAITFRLVARSKRVLMTWMWPTLIARTSVFGIVICPDPTAILHTVE